MQRVKMLRLVANLAIEAKVGASVASDLTALNVVSCLLADHAQAGAAAIGRDQSDDEGADLSSEELLLNAVAACNNISYYACIQTDRYSSMVLDKRRRTPSRQAKRAGSTYCGKSRGASRSFQLQYKH